MPTPGQKLFERCREDFADQTGQELFAEGWKGLTSAEKADWEAHAFEQAEKERNDREDAS